jgi:hypothetical protein
MKNFAVRKAKAEEFERLERLSVKYLFNISIQKQGIAQTIQKENMPFMWVIENMGDIAGAFELSPLGADDYEWYDADSGIKAVQIGKLFWDIKFKERNLRDILLNAIKTAADGAAIFTDILYSPFKNVDSYNLALRCGFELIGIKPHFQPDWGNTEWALFKLD